MARRSVRLGLFAALAIAASLVLQASATLRAAERPAAPAASVASLRGGWWPARPFLVPKAGETEGVQGLDVEVLAAVLRAADLDAHLHRRSWQGQLDDLLAGRADFALGAYRPADGDDRFFYSLPYRQARLSLFVRQGENERYATDDAAGLLRQNPGFRVGLVEGRLYPDPALNAALAGAARNGRVVPVRSEAESLALLLDGRIDGFVADRLAVAATALEAGLKGRAAEIVLPGSAGVHLIFSRATVTADTVRRIDAAITDLERENRLTPLVQARVFSVVMAHAFDSLLFRSLDIVGTIAFALSGVLIAFRERFSLVGALVLSALPAVGGGALRDLLLDRHPIGVLASPLPLCLVVATVVCGLLAILALQAAQRRGRRDVAASGLLPLLTPATVHEVCDAVGLAAFTVSGVAVAVSVDAEPLWLWGPIAAMLTGAGGGILRDIVRQAGHVATLKTEFYAEVPLLWGLLLSLFLISRPALLVPEQVGLAIVVTVVGAFLTRMAAVALGIGGVPFGWPRGTS